MLDGSAYEKVACGFCGGASSRTIFDFGATAIVRCTDCRLVYASPRLREAVMLEVYRKSDYFREVLQTSDDFLAQRETLNDVMLEKVLKQLDRPSANGRLLDLGCGLGRFMQLAHRKGWQAEGWEVSEFAAQFVRERLGFTVHTGPMDLAQIASESYDVVAMIDVLDHVYDPMTMLREVYRVLRPGGCVAMTILNFSGVSTHLFRNRNYVLDTSERGPGHVTFFTRATLRAFLDRAGFSQVVSWVGEIYLKNFTDLFRRLFAPGRSSTELHRRARRFLRPRWWTVAGYRATNWLLAATGLGDQITAVARKSPVA